jgi:hypothetical protein
MTRAHDPKDGWHPLTNDPTWPVELADRGITGLCPKPSEEIPSSRLPVFAGGPNADIQSLVKELLPLEKALVKLMRRVEVMEVHVDVLESREPIATIATRGLGPFKSIPDGQEDCD